MHTVYQCGQQLTPYLYAFSYALACMGLGMEGAVNYDQDDLAGD